MSIPYRIHVQVVATAGDDGSRAASITAEDVAERLVTVGQIYATAEVEFVFNPASDFLKINSTLLNRDFTPLERPNADGKWDHEPLVDEATHGQARNDLARTFTGKLVIFFRNRKKIAAEKDAGGNKTGFWVVATKSGGSSGGNALYVNMSTSSNANSLGHEVGHYLQLWHTHVGDVETVAAAAQAIKNYVEDGGHPKSEGLRALDGDRAWVLDTPSDASGEIFGDAGLTKCGPVGEIPIEVSFSDGTERTYTLAPNRSLVMSYFNCDDESKISPQQARRVRDGLELRLRRDLISPTPSFADRLSRGATVTPGVFAEVDLAQVRAGRVAAALREAGGDLRIVVWDTGEAGAGVTPRGPAPAGRVEGMALCSLGLNMLATAVRDSTGRLKIITWRVEEDRDVRRLEDATREGTIRPFSVAASLLSVNYLATACVLADGTLRVNAWRVAADGAIEHLAEETAGKVSQHSRPAVCGIGGSESFATYTRDESNDLKTILWQLVKEEDGSRVIKRLDSSAAGEAPVDTLTACTLSREVAVAAFKDRDSKLRLVAHRFPGDGTFIERKGAAGAGTITAVDICRVGTKAVVTSVRDGAGKLKLILWWVSANGDSITRLDDFSTNEAFSLLAMCEAGRRQFVTASRNPVNNNMQFIAWSYGSFFQPGDIGIG